VSKVAKMPVERLVARAAEKKVEPSTVKEEARFAGSPPPTSKASKGDSSAAPDGLALPSKAAACAPPSMTAKSARTSSQGEAAFGMNNNHLSVQRVEKAAPDVLVVYCDISSDAAKSKAFDKLLGANGITWRRQPLQRAGDSAEHDDYKRAKRAQAPRSAGVPLAAKNAEKTPALEEARQMPAAKEATQPPALPLLADPQLRQTVAAGNADLVYVEATPAQIRATLAGLQTQPTVFLSFSVQSAQGNLNRQVIHGFVDNDGRNQSNSAGGQLQLGGGNQRGQQQTPAVAAAKPGESAALQNGAENRDKSPSANSTPTSNVAPAGNTSQTVNSAPATNAMPATVAKNDRGVPTQNSPSPPAAESQTQAVGRGQQEPQSQSAVDLGQLPWIQQQTVAQSPSRQRVLFVLRIGGRPLSEASQVRSQAGANEAKPAPPTSVVPPAPPPSK
jgi:hypothetical protein